MEKMLGTGELVRQLRGAGYRVTVTYVDRLASDGLVAPSGMVSGHRLWDPDAIEQVAEILRRRGRLGSRSRDVGPGLGAGSRTEAPEATREGAEKEGQSATAGEKESAPGMWRQEVK